MPYDSDAADIDGALWRLRDYTSFFTAGNDGPTSATLGSASKNDVLVAATDGPTNGGSLENLTDYSSHGPTCAGRLKPDGERRATGDYFEWPDVRCDDDCRQLAANCTADWRGC